MTKQQKLVLIITIIASFVAFLDGTIVNVALPSLAKDLGGGLPVQQWVVNAYLITLGACILLAGSLADLFGRKKILGAGLIGFGLTSLLCAIAPAAPFLIIARALQGLAGALLVPSSLALIISAFRDGQESKAIGTWTSWTASAAIVGPLVGGFLVDSLSWRLVFAINIVPIAITLWLLRRCKAQEQRAQQPNIDIPGAILCTTGLSLTVYALIAAPQHGWGSWQILAPLVAGCALFVGFLVFEKHTPQPMLPLRLFKSRNFSVGNIATAGIYAGLSMSVFLLIIFVQQVGHYSAINAGLIMLPSSIAMITLSSRFGALAGKYGPRWFMTIGPLICAVGFLWYTRIDEQVHYWSQVFPGVALFGLGLSITVAPLTAAVLGGIAGERSGIASAVNNAVARVAGLLATAAAGIVVGEHLSVTGLHHGAIAMAGLLAFGGIVSAIGIQNPRRKVKNEARLPGAVA